MGRTSGDNLVRSAESAAAAGNWPQALFSWHHVVHGRGDASNADRLGFAYEQLGRLGDALASYELAISASGDDAKRIARLTSRTKLLRAALERDGHNVSTYGSNAARFAERIWVHPSTVTRHLPQSDAEKLTRVEGRVKMSTGFITPTWPKQAELDISHHDKIAGLLKRWGEDLPWSETGIIERLNSKVQIFGKRNGCISHDDVVKRYDVLDKQFRTIKAEGRFRLRHELDKSHFRELGGVLMHLGPDGEPIFGSRGYHRLAMAQALNLWIPCQIGIVHESALPLLEKYRKAPPASSSPELSN